MYFNSDNVNTTNNNKNKYLLVVIGLIILITLIIIIIISLSNNDNDIENNNTSIKNNQIFNIKLIGEKEITIYKDSEYIEPGYTAYDNKNIDYTNDVLVTSNLDTTTIGEYKITYTINNIFAERIVNVIEKPIGATYFYLKGDAIIYLNESEKYVEPGYIVIDTVDENLNDKVKVTDNINYSIPGTYKVIYSVINSSGVTTNTTRTVIVLGSELTVTVNNTEYTNKPVEINIFVKDNYFDYILLPNGNKVTENSYTYKVTENGTYKFASYSKKGSTKEKTVTINNIDLELPTGTCSLTIKDDKSYITIDAKDNLGIKKYLYNNKEYQETIIDVADGTESAKITIYDTVGNNKEITCTVNKLKTEMYGFILIGDSRFVGMDTYVNQPSNVYIVAKTSMGYNWLVDTAISKVNNILSSNPGKKFYIFSNLGINDYTYKSYASKLNSLASNEWKNHKVGFISVNPYAGNTNSSKTQAINEFNKKEKNKLNGVYYCDTFNGIGVSNFGCASYYSDCLHYNSQTYKKIYNYIMENCKF